MDWNTFWEKKQVINDLILTKWAQFYYKSIREKGLLEETDYVLDYGAGNGAIALAISGIVNNVLAYDPSVTMYKSCTNMARDCEKVVCTNLTPFDCGASVVLINSVVQYMDNNELEKTLDFITNNTKASKAIISDIAPKKYNILVDLFYNLVYSFKNKFFIEYCLFAINQLFHRVGSRGTLILRTYDSGSIIQRMSDRGWVAYKINNLSPSVVRYSLFCYR